MLLSNCLVLRTTIRPRCLQLERDGNLGSERFPRRSRRPARKCIRFYPPRTYQRRSPNGIGRTTGWRNVSQQNQPVVGVRCRLNRRSRASFTVGLPGYRQISGFVLAILGVWLISRSEGDSPRPQGLGLAILSGIGFAGFYLCINQAKVDSALWLAVISRCGSLLVTAAVVLLGRNPGAVARPAIMLAVSAGMLDTTGSALFVRATQTGRLDEAVVLSSLYPAITVLLARLFLHEHFSRGKTLGMLAAIAAVPMIAG